jgi:hypothetical protein
MSNDSRELDKNTKLVTDLTIAPADNELNVDALKTAFIVESLDAKSLATKFAISESTAAFYIEKYKLEDLRSSHVKEGLTTIKNVQLSQAEKLMDIESQFKRMRILQLESILEDHAAYFQRHGHFYRTHPVTGEILLDHDKMPVPIKLPNVTKELNDLKESVTMSEGLKHILSQIDDVINKPKPQERLSDDPIDMLALDDMFKRKESE